MLKKVMQFLNGNNILNQKKFCSTAHVVIKLIEGTEKPHNKESIYAVCLMEYEMQKMTDFLHILLKEINLFQSWFLF